MGYSLSAIHDSFIIYQDLEDELRELASQVINLKETKRKPRKYFIRNHKTGAVEKISGKKWNFHDRLAGLLKSCCLSS